MKKIITSNRTALSEADGKYVVRSSEEKLPTEEVNELFYAIARH